MVLPPELGPVSLDDRVASKVMQDLTVYLSGPSEAELEWLIALYERVCPEDRRLRYTIAELDYWSYTHAPDLTETGREAAEAGMPRPYLEPVRRRIRDGRAFEISFWDGVPIDDSRGSWSFSYRRIHLRSGGLHAFARFLLPIDVDSILIPRLARAIVDSVDVRSGHGGLAFVFDPWLLEAAFDAIYAQARRFWGVDVEYLNQTLPLLSRRLKGVNWVTVVGNDLISEREISQALDGLSSDADVRTAAGTKGVVIVAGQMPDTGDQHRDSAGPAPYRRVAEALAPLFLTEHPDFPGPRFIENGNTLGWIRRFIEPEGWR